MPDTQGHIEPRPDQSDQQTRLVQLSKGDWIMLAKLAWMNNPNESIASQMSAETNVSLRTCQYWMSMKTTTVPPMAIRRMAYELATRKFNRYADLLDRLDGLEPATPAAPTPEA